MMQAIELFKSLDAFKEEEKEKEKKKEKEKNKDADKDKNKKVVKYKPISLSGLCDYIEEKFFEFIEKNKLRICDIDGSFLKHFITRCETACRDLPYAAGKNISLNIAEAMAGAICTTLTSPDSAYRKDHSHTQQFVLIYYLSEIYVNYLKDPLSVKIIFEDAKVLFKEASDHEENKAYLKKIDPLLTAIGRNIEKLLRETKEKVNTKELGSIKQEPSDAKQRRYDSIAWLIQGDNTCGASFFDGESLLLATNHPDETGHTENVITYLRAVAKWSAKLTKGQVTTVSACELACKSSRDKLIRNAFVNVDFFQDNNEYKRAFFRALRKVTRSIIYSYTHDEKHCKAFPRELSNAIQNNKILKIDQSSHYIEGLHAELQILNYLIFTKCSFERFFKTKKHYIGVSKKCCANCCDAIEAVDRFLRDHHSSIRSEVHRVINNKNQFISTRADHKLLFYCAIPPFLEKIPILGKYFLEISKCKTLEEAFGRLSSREEIDHRKQTHDSSRTIDESSSPRYEYSDSEDLFSDEEDNKKNMSITSMPAEREKKSKDFDDPVEEFELDDADNRNKLPVTSESVDNKETQEDVDDPRLQEIDDLIEEIKEKELRKPKKILRKNSGEDVLSASDDNYSESNDSRSNSDDSSSVGSFIPSLTDWLSLISGKIDKARACNKLANTFFASGDFLNAYEKYTKALDFLKFTENELCRRSGYKSVALDKTIKTGVEGIRKKLITCEERIYSTFGKNRKTPSYNDSPFKGQTSASRPIAKRTIGRDSNKPGSSQQSTVKNTSTARFMHKKNKKPNKQKQYVNNKYQKKPGDC